MGRAQTFDTDRVVRAALGVFWRSGYEAASVPALEEATGLNRSSIYHAFGSKRGLFDAAVQAYLDDVVRPRLRTLTDDTVDHPDPDAVVRYFTGLRAALAATGEIQADSGCLLVNASGAPIARDPAVRRVVADYRAELRAALGRGVDARYPGRPAAERDRLADLCTALVVSAFALVRVDPDSATGALDGALELLGAGGH
ncbi:TetR family transcriptional regulator [Isoptericola jiangsuensis]|uniref:TetR family transcriptional regulator n=2 Tax=Isoptericola jiangsuensis TaxID=548579 RepID=A0A2A9ESM1_9MICO|nr:TetR/AcrR family transcriptional regulator [Isoptericola jiangsuensis]PFG41556.1 TetR family transcriptional regulator [Isoptericola jiangsuensis]